MQLSKEALKSFIKIYKEHFGEVLTDEEANEKALQLLIVIKLIYRRIK